MNRRDARSGADRIFDLDVMLFQGELICHGIVSVGLSIASGITAMVIYQDRSFARESTSHCGNWKRYDGSPRFHRRSQ